MDPLTLENEKAVLLVEPMKTTIQVSIFDTDHGTSHIYTLTAEEAGKLQRYLLRAFIKVATVAETSEMAKG